MPRSTPLPPRKKRPRKIKPEDEGSGFFIDVDVEVSFGDTYPDPPADRERLTDNDKGK